MFNTALDRQLEFCKFCTAVCEVVVREQETSVLVPAILSGTVGSISIAITTKTSLLSGSMFRSTCSWVKVFAAASAALNPIAIVLLVCFRPVGMCCAKTV